LYKSIAVLLGKTMLYAESKAFRSTLRIPMPSFVATKARRNSRLTRG